MYQYSYKNTSPYPQQGTNTAGVHTISVDSAGIIDGDSVFYFNKLQRYTDNFWGRTMTKKPGGKYLFAFTTGDTMVIKTKAIIGDQWVFNLNESTYTATYISFQKETILNTISDSVKTFILQKTSGFIDSIKVSKNYGVVYYFPISQSKKRFILSLFCTCTQI